MQPQSPTNQMPQLPTTPYTSAQGQQQPDYAALQAQLQQAQSNLMQQSMALQQQLSQRYGAVSPNGTPLAPPMAMQAPPPMMMQPQQSFSQPAYNPQPSFQMQPSFRAGASTAIPPPPPPPFPMAPAQVSSPMKAFNQQMVAVPNGRWTTGLFDCFCTDTYVCLGSSWACQYAENVRKLKGGAGGAPTTFWAAYCCALCCPCLDCIYGGNFRGELRQKYALPAEPCGDCLVYFFCGSCATCQEARELRAREGWHTWKD